MRKEKSKEKSYCKQEIFAESAFKNISSTLKPFGFNLHRKEVETYFTSIIWRKNNQYVKVEGSNHPIDDFFGYNIVLGEW